MLRPRHQHLPVSAQALASRQCAHAEFQRLGGGARHGSGRAVRPRAHPALHVCRQRSAPAVEERYEITQCVSVPHPSVDRSLERE